MPPAIQQMMIENAPTFLDESNDPEVPRLDLERIKAFSRPILLTAGEQSPPILGSVVAKLDRALSSVEVVTLAGAGHIPHMTHPDAYI